MVVALLGIEITIIALASAASAATHPEGSPAQGSLYEAGPYGWEDAPAQWRAAMDAALSDAYEVEPDMAYEGLMAAGRQLEQISDWPAIDTHWPLEQVERAHEARDRASTAAESAAEAATRSATRSAAEAEDLAWAQKPKARPEATKAAKSPVRTGVAKMPRARAHAAHRRAQVDLTRVLPRKAAMQVSHATATGWLKSAGLRTKSTGNCVSKHMHHCTSLDSVRTGTIAKAIALKQRSGCPIMVTGGTERGHAPGHFSHGNGYKLDISHNACIDRHISKNHDKAGIRSDGARLYKSGSGTTFADEGDHWDILFR
ncbi:hypothetical protein [Nonomuraea sp. NPDC049709]|uniref:hypothetical protein n=1 Tax=Nonomuraea sp. NPDC049709 TaxID=3154736 RepID=UPI0034165D22